MDGNRRWAKARGLTTPEGHEAGAQALKKIVQLSAAWGIRATTMFAFSQENFKRPQASKADRHACYTYGTVEVDLLMYLIEFMIRDKMDLFVRRPASLQGAIREAEEMTRNNSRHQLILATCYSGRWDIVQACRELTAKAQDNLLRPEDIDESMLASHLATNVLGDQLACPDLLIRTSGELRLSSFLLWQCAYSELYFIDTLWPDFGEDDYSKAHSHLPEVLVQSGLRPELMPKHVAIVMDGNRRWAKARGLTTPEGHEAGAQALKKIVQLSAAWGIRATTMFAFSQENFKRPQASKQGLAGQLKI
ncbi:hypothetical protein HU200_019820 [Digitaria exilis]|uniref:Alkyl transferase n=1 Tax=Digitaria exilis TaxID=1010633 RepID=A0A835F2J1_9POAL|nr:hypothetical protein HU200_019820 [Digitaria exilis]